MIRTTAALLTLASAAAAQESITLDIDSNQTAFTYGGTTSAGPIAGNPASFTLVGDAHAVFGVTAGTGVDTIQLVSGGSALVSPDIDAYVPAPLPFLPPLATIQITNLTLGFTSDVATVDPVTGAFSTMVTTTALSGVATVTPLTGGTSTQDLTGTTSTPQPLDGTVSMSGTTVTVDSTIATTFMFTDPGSGTSATINLNGTLIAGSTADAPATYCTSTPNSSGAAAALTPLGSASLTAADLVLDATALPMNQFCLFFCGDQDDFVPGFAGSQGNLCIGGTLYRFNGYIQNSGAAGATSLAVPFDDLPPGATFDAGETWYFQTWFRDVTGGVATSNTTNGVRVTFHP